MEENISTKEFTKRVKNIIGQLEGVLKLVEEDREPEEILNQFKAVEQAVKSSGNFLLNDIYRKVLALKLSRAIESCPGDCGQEELIDKMRVGFPDLREDEVLKSIKEIEHSLKTIYRSLKNKVN